MNVEKYVIPEICNDDDWNYLLGRTQEKDRIWDPSNKFSAGVTPIKGHQLLVVDVYTEWSGPCIAAESFLRRMRHSFVEAPDTLTLARACCDKIKDLEPFKFDIRPTFLFWARGAPVALLRGANRPLLTRLINEEVRIESHKLDRPVVEIDFFSPRVIQCGSNELASLEDDDTVKSIGMGKTEKLSLLLTEEEIAKLSNTSTACTTPEPHESELQERDQVEEHELLDGSEHEEQDENHEAEP